MIAFRKGVSLYQTIVQRNMRLYRGLAPEALWWLRLSLARRKLEPDANARWFFGRHKFLDRFNKILNCRIVRIQAVFQFVDLSASLRFVASISRNLTNARTTALPAQS
jgi:hypothetical protein